MSIRFLITVLLAAVVGTGTNGQPNADHSALLVIDIQDVFTRDQMDPGESAKLLGSVNELITRVRPGVHVIFVQANVRMLTISFREGIKVKPSEHQALDDRLFREPDDPVFRKNERSALTLPDLTGYLDSLGVDHLFLSGIMLGECLSATALHARENGFQVTVVKETVAARKPRKAPKLLADLEASGVTVISMEDLGRVL